MPTKPPLIPNRERFGRDMNVLALGVTGHMTEPLAEGLTGAIVKAIGCREGPGSATFRYPNEDIGFIHIRCLIESFVAVDWWEPHFSGGFVFVISCKDFDPRQVHEVIESLGLQIISGLDGEVHI